MPPPPIRRPAPVAPTQQVKQPPPSSREQPFIPATISSFSKISDVPLGTEITLIGKAGIGKTSLCAELPSPLFICDPLETGIIDLVQKGRVKVSREQILVHDTMAELKMILSELANTKHTIKTVIYESYSGLEKMIMSNACETRWKNDWGKGGFLNYQEGPRACASRDVPEIISLFQKIRMKGINVVITGHTMIKNQSNAEGADYNAELPQCISKDMFSELQKWSENIIYMVYQVNTEKASDGKLKATGGAPTLVMHRTGGYEAKNKWGVNTYVSIDGLTPREVWEKICREGKMDPSTMRSL